MFALPYREAMPPTRTSLLFTSLFPTHFTSPTYSFIYPLFDSLVSTPKQESLSASCRPLSIKWDFRDIATNAGHTLDGVVSSCHDTTDFGHHEASEYCSVLACISRDEYM